MRPEQNAKSEDPGTAPTLERLVRLLDAELAGSTVADDGLAGPAEPAAQLIRFAVGASVFAVAVEQLSEVDSVPPATFVPRAPSAIRGLANLRGEVITLLDLGRFLGLAREASRSATTLERMIVLHDAGQGRPGGVIVDRVFGIASYRPEAMIPASLPPGMPPQAGPYISGMAMVDEEHVPVIDLQRVAESIASWPTGSAR